jgi:hypothetical protein
MHAGPPPPPSSGSAAQRIRTSPYTKFRNAVSSVVRELDEHIGEPYSVSQLHKRHQLKARRLYDVMNVFSAIGCAQRLNGEQIVWVGRDEIVAKLQQDKKALGVSNADVALSRLFPPENSVGLTSLTIAFLMLFPALGTREIDLREASSFFARTTKKYKTVLCKLYQIAVILGALGLTNKTQNMCEVRMMPPLEPLLAVDESPISIGKLLNRPTDGDGQYKARRDEYKSFARPGGKRADESRDRE